MCVQLQAAVVNNWNSVKSFIDNKGLNDFNGTQIQSNRYEILLNFDFHLVKKDQMWKMFRTLTKFTDQQGSFMLEYVEYLSRSYLGMKKDEWTLSTPSLIITDSQEDQTPHLDVMNPRTRRQFGLIIAEGVVSTKVYEPNKDDSLNLTEALKLLKDAPAENKEMDWTTPSSKFMGELLSLCEENSVDIKQFDEEFRNGVGQLFRVIHNSECYVKKDDFKF